MSARTIRFLFLNLGHAYAHMFLLIYPTVVLVLERRAEGSYADLLLPSTAGFVVFGLATVPAGWLGDRWSRRGMMALMFFGLGLAGTATAFAQSTLGLTLGLALIGLAAAIYHPVGIAMVVEHSTRVGRSLGINGVWGNMGVAAAPLAAGLLSEAFGWRAAFLVPAAISFVTGFAFLWFVPLEQDGPGAVEAHRPARSPLTSASLLRLAAALGIATFCGGLVFHALTVALPKILEVRLGETVQEIAEIGGMASLVFALAAFTQILVGWAIDRAPFRAIWVGVIGLQVPAFLVLSMTSGWGGLGFALLTTALVFGEIPLSDALVSRFASAEWRSRVYGLKYVLSLGVSALAVPLVAWLYDRGGFDVLLPILAVLALTVACMGLLIPSGRGEAETVASARAPS